MPQALVRQQSPEEREYARYLGEIEVRRLSLADLQTDLAAYKERLGSFVAAYHSRVGVLFVELDQIELAIAEYKFRLSQLRANRRIAPEGLEHKTKKQFTDQREQVDEDEEETRYYQREHREESKRPELDEAAEISLKSLYRELAKRFHPDLAKTEVERHMCEVVMREINKAFHECDINQLRSIGARSGVNDPAFEQKTTGENLVWAIREISGLEDLIDSILLEREELETSELSGLWTRHASGENVIERLETELSHRIERKRERLQMLIDDFHTRASEVYGG